jgi:DNA polymerase-3 subunit gamma/tau
MSYVVLARKYRPKNFAEMVGQAHVVTALGNALTTQRLHHAYLFTGTRGVGKTTVSRILAKSLNCVGADGQGGITATPCGVCPACTDIDSGRFVDYTELDAASNRGVDEVQALLEQAVYKPVQGRFKVFMIDEVHMLTNTAFNAMLKTLEEPPEYLKFVLATTDPQKVPVTVLSRCLQFNLRPMAPETVFEHLGQVLHAEGVASEPAALRLLARAARGSMRDALSLTDQAIAFGGGGVLEVPVRQMLGAVGRAHVFALVDALARSDGRQVVDTIDGLRAQGLSAASTLEEMTDVLQRMAVAQLADADPDPADPEAAEVLRLADLLPADQTQLLYSLCLHGRAELGLASDEYAALVMVLLRLLAFQPPGQAARVAAPVAPPAATVPVPASRPAPVATLQPAVFAAPAEKKSPEPVAQLSQHLPQLVSPTPTAQPVESLGEVYKEKSASVLAIKQECAIGIGSVSVVEAALVNDAVAQLSSATDPAPPAGADAPSMPAGLDDFWFDQVQAMVRAESIGALVRELALQSQLVAWPSAAGGECVLRTENPSLNQPAARERLRQALALLGHAVQLRVEGGAVQRSPARRLAAAASQRLDEAERMLRQDPLVQGLMNDFGARIVPGSIQPLSP